MKIDVHTHILPEHWPDLVNRYGYPGWVRIEHHAPCRARMMIGNRVFREIGDNCWSAGRRIEECDASGVSVQVISTVPVMFSYWANASDTLDLSRRLNDHVAEVVRAEPSRFVGLGTLPLQSPELSIGELNRCVEQLGLAGVQIGTHVNDWNLDEPALFPVFERAAELDAAMFVHPWDMLGKERMSRYWLPWLVGMPAETALAICSMIFGGVLERLPALRIAFAHGGGAFPGTIGRIEHGFHVRPDLCAVHNPASPRSYLARADGTPARFYVDSLTHDEDALRQLLKLMGPRRVLLGSDYPFPLGEDRPGELIESMKDIGENDRDRLFWRNALEFLGGRATSAIRKGFSP